MGRSDRSSEHGSTPREATMRGETAVVEWVYVDADGNETGTSEAFETQSDAETWFGTNWETLAANGTTHVALRDTGDGSEIYRMGLGPE
jgi:hypothetical protein